MSLCGALLPSEQRTDSESIPPPLQTPEAAFLPSEVLSLRKLPLAGLYEVEDSALRRSAKALLLRFLEQLCVRLRPWTESEREWLWGLARDLVGNDARWLAQFFRQVNWDCRDEAKVCVELLERHHEALPGREALQILGGLGRSAEQAALTLGERRLGLAAKYAAQRLQELSCAELCCCLELLLDAGHELGSAGATGGRRAIFGALLETARGKTPAAAGLCNELFWALEARVGHAGEEDWASVALQELLQHISSERELGLLRQHTWVRQMERGNYESCKVDPWGESRKFPLAVWPPYRSCLGVEGLPRKTDSKSAPVIVRCRFHDEATTSPAPNPRGPISAIRPSSKEVSERRKSSGVLLKRDVGMHREQQVGQTLRLLEVLIWEDPELQTLLRKSGLVFEDVRATYTIVMTGHGTAMLEYIDGARTLREVRSGGDSSASALGTRLLFSPGERGTLFTFLRQHNNKQDLPKALARLAFTAAVSAVLSFVAGLGDRHHENFMVTVDGRLVHVDFGYALGREPLDSVLIHIAVQGGRPATTIQYEELYEAPVPMLGYSWV
ncbi:Pik3cb [Symbiodinium natans]|uniref:Pik3cb protein n=1 Tax=Symbiodinium natans TaxID=878477 RepID=A0A812G284_9DINO|nr:Pik3cb [Symbiodinium natans]